MAGENSTVDNTANVSGDGNTGTGEVDTSKLLETPEVKAALERLVQEQLSEIKGKLDNAYGERDAAKKALSEKEKAINAAEAERLEKEGKVAEALKLKVDQLEKEKAEEAAKSAEAESRIVELTRNLEISTQLASADFKNVKAKSSAEREIRLLLVKNDKGQWVGENNKPLKTVVQEYLADPENSYLLKAPINSGSGTGGDNKPAGGARKKLVDMPQDEVLALAAQGKL